MSRWAKRIGVVLFAAYVAASIGWALDGQPSAATSLAGIAQDQQRIARASDCIGYGLQDATYAAHPECVQS